MDCADASICGSFLDLDRCQYFYLKNGVGIVFRYVVWVGSKVWVDIGTGGWFGTWLVLGLLFMIAN